MWWKTLISDFNTAKLDGSETSEGNVYQVDKLSQFVPSFTVRAPSSHLVELLPGQGTLNAPRPYRPLLLDCVLEHGLEGHQHPQHVLRAQCTHVHCWRMEE